MNAAVELIALASSVSLLAGWRVSFHPTKRPDMLARTGSASPASNLGEFFADKIAWVERLSRGIRPFGGALPKLALTLAG